MNDRPVIMITGAAGVLGRALIEELATDFELVALRHRTPVADGRVSEISGAELVRPDLGLDARTRRTLLERVDIVLHAAAETNWNLPAAEIHRRNVDGTAHPLAFAAAAGARFCHVSTAFVARPPRAQSVRCGDGVAAYVDSKIAAEDLVRTSGLRSVIIRPSVITGDSTSGRIARYQGLHAVIGALIRGTVPLIPADAGSLVDCLPQDLVARATGVLLRRGVDSGEYWLTAGTEAVTVGDAVEVSLEAAAAAGLPAVRPRELPVEVVDRLLVPLLDGLMDRRLRRTLESLVELLVVFQSTSALPSSMADLGLAAQCRRPLLRAALRRSADAWVANQFGRPSVEVAS